MTEKSEVKQDSAPKRLLVVSIAKQCLELQVDGNLQCVYPVSTSVKGAGSACGSERTPLGMHRICAMIGAAAPSGAVFRGRVRTGEIVQPDDPAYAGQDLITTRILWLDGLEPGINQGEGVDSRSRYIYIHGTQAEALIGQAASHGCIRMRNADVIDLFERVAEGDRVLITE
jgi:hypothetical protein